MTTNTLRLGLLGFVLRVLGTGRVDLPRQPKGRDVDLERSRRALRLATVGVSALVLVAVNVLLVWRCLPGAYPRLWEPFDGEFYLESALGIGWMVLALTARKALLRRVLRVSRRDTFASLFAWIDLAYVLPASTLLWCAAFAKHTSDYWVCPGPWVVVLTSRVIPVVQVLLVGTALLWSVRTWQRACDLLGRPMAVKAIATSAVTACLTFAVLVASPKLLDLLPRAH